MQQGDNLPPGPRPSVRQLWSFIHRPGRYQAWLRRRYGDIVTLTAPHSRLVMTLTPEGARQLFTAEPGGFDAFPKHAFTGLAGAGSLWVLEGPRHRRERQLLAPAFLAQRIQDYGRAIQEIALLHTNRWRPVQEIRAYEAMLGISRDVMLRVVFGLERGAAVDQGRLVLSRVLHCVHPWTALFPALQTWWFPPWARYQRARQACSTFVAHRLAERRADRDDVQDVLGLLLAARYDDGSPMGDDEIRDEIFTILVSGHETTPVALAWALYELGRHSSVLERLRAELDVLGPDPNPDLIVRQPYLGAVCDETLRLHTILPEVARSTRTPLELLGYTIPAGIGVGVGISAIHHEPGLYPDPDEFRPERFLERAYSPFEFLPFGGGHRRCLGAALAAYEMRLALATVATRWEIDCAGEDREIRHAVATGPQHGVPMRVSERRRGVLIQNCVR